jgi:hypothetical protein
MAGMLLIDYQSKSPMRSEHLDYLPLHEGGPIGIYFATRPPCNDPISITSLVIMAAGAAMSYNSAQNAAKQSEYNAQAQSDAIGQEQQRQAIQEQENQRRAVVEQRRFRASQLAAMGGSGAMLGTGSTLALEADTWAKQQTDLADQQRMSELSQRNLAYQASSTLEMGKQQASQMRAEATGQAVANLGSMAMAGGKAWTTRPQAAAPTYDSAGVVRAVPVK